MVSLPYDGRVPEPPYRTDMEERLDEAAAEIARRRDEALRRALNTPPKPKHGKIKKQKGADTPLQKVEHPKAETL